MKEYEIPFSFCHEQRHFRLVELPPALLDSIVSEDPSLLQLKSAPTHQSSGVNTAPDAVVCTLNETFEVRQVQSSNVLYILQSIEGSKEGTIDASYSGGVTAIAQCKGLLELVKASPVPEQYLRTHVHIYRYEAGTSSVAAHGPTKQELLDDAPFSSGEFQAAWEQLCIFELEGKLWLPAASILRKTWTSFLSAALVEDVDATKPFQVDTVKVLVEEDGYLGSLLEAIFTQVASKMDDITSGHMHHDHNQSNANAIKVVLIDREKCIEWLGSILVELASQVPLRLLNFIEEWRNMVPEVWREHVDLTKLRAEYAEAGDGMVVFLQPQLASNKSTAPARISTISKSKWHERFRNPSAQN